MTFRDCALAAIAHREASDLPVDVWENGIHPTLAAGLFAEFGLQPGHPEVLLRRLGAHFRWGSPVYVGPELKTVELPQPPAWPFTRISRGIWGTLDGIETYTDTIARPLAAAETVKEIESHAWPDPDWFDYATVCWLIDSRQTQHVLDDWAQANRDYCLVVGGWNPMFSRLMDLFGMQRGLRNIIAEPQLIEAAIAGVGDYLCRYYERLARAASGKAQILGYGDDFAGQNGMLISPGHWRRFFLPLLKKLFAIGHKYGFKNQMHMCGSIRPVIPDLIEAGLDIYENLQSKTKGMDAAGLKRDFGRDLVFYGGIDVQQDLPFLTPSEIFDETRRFIDIMAGDGGYILASTHFLLGDIPAKNVIAMYEAAGSLQRP